MEYKKDFLEGENIPDFALQPARPASTFDPTAYDKLFENLKQAKVSKEDTIEKPLAKTAEKAEETAESTVATLEDEGEREEKAVAAAAEVAEEVEPVVARAVEEVSETALEDAVLATAESEEFGKAVSEDVTAANEIEMTAEDIVAGTAEDVQIAETVETVQVVEAMEAEQVAEEAPETAGPVMVADAEDALEDTIEEAKPAAAKIKSLPVAPVAAKPTAEKPKANDKKLVLMPDSSSANLYREVSYTDFKNLDPITVRVEEDILITDAKPDMGEMLWVEGNCHLAERSMQAGGNNVLPVRLSGDIKIQALYNPAKGSGEKGIISLDARIPFREDALVKTEQNADLVLDANVKSMRWERINERKFRVLCEIEVALREYSKRNMGIFEGVQNEELQLLHKEVGFTDIAIRKSDIIEISEEFKLPDGAAEIENISCFNVSITEKHKQVSDEKAMINGEAYLNVLVDSIEGPMFYGFNSNFTHFVKIDEDIKNPLSGGCVNFTLLDCSLTPKRDEEGYYTIMELDMEVGLDLEYYCQIQEDWVADAYHYSKDVSWDKRDIELNKLLGIETADLSIREIIDVPENGEKIGKVIYISSGEPTLLKAQMNKGVMTAEGLLPIRLVCVAEDSENQGFYIKKDVNFIVEMNIDGCREEMYSDCQLVLKQLSFDKINNRQVSINADLRATGCVFDKNLHSSLHSVNVVAREPEKGPQPSIIVYSAKNDDTVWKVAKRYSTPSSRLRLINNLDEHEEIKPGSKVLIVR